MEKKPGSSSANHTRRVVITGPECSGKTTLAEQLSQRYQTTWVTEFARHYIENLREPYHYEDVARIARIQIRQLTGRYPGATDYLFFDTGLVITKIWFSEVFHTVPAFLEKALASISIDLYLLCTPDLVWKEDPVRENPGARREYLFGLYRQTLEAHGFPYRIVTGHGPARLSNAIQALDEFFG